MPHGGLAIDSPPGGGSQPFDEYTSDPSQPVEYIDKIEIGMTGDYMIQDQRVAAATAGRPGLLQRRPQGGPDHRRPDRCPAVRLDQRDRLRLGRQADRRLSRRLSHPGPRPATVKFGGYQQLVRGDVMRGKFRNSLSKPEPFVPASRRP